jgi:hypothetical protein
MINHAARRTPIESTIAMTGRDKAGACIKHLVLRLDANSEPRASQAAFNSLTLSSELKLADRWVLRRIGASSGLAQSRKDEASMISEPPAKSQI